MRSFRLLQFIALAFIFLITGCKKESSDGDSSEFMKANIATTFGNFTLNSGEEDTEVYFSGSSLQISGYNETNTSVTEVELYLNAVTGTGTFPLSGSNYAEVYCANQNDDDDFETSGLSNAGSVTITSFSATEISGTYSFTAKSSLTGKTATVTNGSFKIKLSGTSIPTGPGTGTFAVKGQTYTGNCIGTPNGSGGTNVTIANTSEALVIYNMPSAASGSFTINPFTGSNTNLYILTSPGMLASVSGTLSKTGAKSFTFTGQVKDISTNQTYNISGSGSY